MRARLALTILLLSVVAPAATAQEAGTTWYLNNFTTTDGSGAFLSIDGPAGNDMTSTVLDQTSSTKLSFSENEAGFPAGYLGGAGEGQAWVYVKSWNNGPAPETEVTITIKAGDEVVGSGSQTHDVMLGAIVEYTVTFAYELGDIPADTLITMDVEIASPVGGNPFFYPRGDGSNHWRVFLPVTGIEAVTASGTAPVFEDLVGTALETTFENATTAAYTYNFTNDLPAAVASFHVNGTGFANATLVDANGTELFNGTAETAAIELGNVTTGAWQLKVDYTDFNGTFGFELLDPEVHAQAGDGVDEDPAQAVDGNATGNETVDGATDDEEAPGVALPFLALSLVAAIVVSRRR